MNAGLILLAVVMLLLPASELRACDCCATPYTSHGGAISRDWLPQELQSLAALHLSGKLALHPGERRPAFKLPSLQIKAHFDKQTLIFGCYSGKEKIGELRMELSGQYLEFLTDLQLIIPQQSRSSSVQLYKEVRLDGMLQADSAWQHFTGLKIAPGCRLVLHGIGDRCWDVQAFHSWTLHYGLEFDDIPLKGFGYGKTGAGTEASRQLGIPPVISAGNNARSAAKITPRTSTGPKVHIVQAGQNMYRIAVSNGLDYRDIAKWNRIPPPYVLEVGQTILLEPSDTP